jgi:WD40 repeat protein
LCHPRLPLVAGEELNSQVAHVWDFGGGQLREVGTISEAAGGRHVTYRLAMAWEAGESLLVAAGNGIMGAAGIVARWTPAGVAGLGGLPPSAGYSYLEFSPDGRALWASPSRDDSGWALSDIVDLDSGIIWAAQRWDTGVAVHPAGGLVATLASEAGATQVVFPSLPDQGRAPAAMRLLRRALILDHDGYQPPVFSPDGRYLAIRGNSYGHSLDVFEFPSLSRVLATDLEPCRAGMNADEQWDWFCSWSGQNIAFGAQPGVLWTGTPAGMLTETDLESHQTASHDVLDGSPVTGLAATASGDLIVATRAGDLALVSVPASRTTAPAADALQAQAAAFRASTSVVPDDRELWAHLVVTDGVRTWEPDDLATITTTTAADPAWLRMTAASNDARSRRWS